MAPETRGLQQEPVHLLFSHSFQEKATFVLSSLTYSSDLKMAVGHSYILQGGVASSSSPTPTPSPFSSPSSSFPPPSLLSLPLLLTLSSSIFSEFWLKTKMPMASQALLVEVTSLLDVVYIHKASLEAQMVKNLPAVQRTQVRSLGQEDPLEKGMTTCSSILA